MVDGVTIDLRSALSMASRESVLRYLGSVISEFTIMARDPEMTAQEKAGFNNSIHYVSGHLVALTDPSEPLDGRLDGILEQAAKLHPGPAASIGTKLK